MLLQLRQLPRLARKVLLMARSDRSGYWPRTRLDRNRKFALVPRFDASTPRLVRTPVRITLHSSYGILA
jgi:hypothetical protein